MKLISISPDYSHCPWDYFDFWVRFRGLARLGISIEPGYDKTETKRMDGDHYLFIRVMLIKWHIGLFLFRRRG